MDEDLNKIIAILKHLNLRLENPTLDYLSRFKIQKFVYLSEALGISLKYKFSLYLHGPYSPDLARAYYKCPKPIMNLESNYKFNESESAILEKIKRELLENSINETYELELLEAVSAILFLKSGDLKQTDEDIFSNTKNLKPHIKDLTIISAINKIKTLLFKPELITAEVKKEMEIWEKARD